MIKIARLLMPTIIIHDIYRLDINLSLDIVFEFKFSS
jgi:hypothetical protein